MQLRLGIQSRITKDIDLLNKELSASIHESLVESASLDIGDWFTFEVGQTEEAPQDLFSGHRYQDCQLRIPYPKTGGYSSGCHRH